MVHATLLGGRLGVLMGELVRDGLPWLSWLYTSFPYSTPRAQAYTQRARVALIIGLKANSL